MNYLCLKPSNQSCEHSQFGDGCPTAVDTDLLYRKKHERYIIRIACCVLKEAHSRTGTAVVMITRAMTEYMAE